MYERFTDRAHKVWQLANAERQRLNHAQIDTEHILLGLLKEGRGVAAHVFEDRGIGLPIVKQEAEKLIHAGATPVTADKAPPTAAAKRVVEFAIEEARQLNHSYVGTEHLLLGLLREQQGVAAMVLAIVGLKLADARAAVVNLLGPRPVHQAQDRPSPAVVADLPAEVRHPLEEFDNQIDRLTLQKEEAIAAQDYEKAAHLRDQAEELKQRKKGVLHDWAANKAVDPSWLSWNEGIITRMARAISEEESWEDLPALAGALESAGCTSSEVLEHCRRPGQHYAACWVLDWLLGKL
jgi:ATP-dependent Clp protease ATP-binding subunit ClpA